MDIASPLRSKDDPDRILDCEDAIEAAIASVERAAVEAGWNPVEVAMAMMDLGRARLQAMIETAERAITGGLQRPH